VIEAMGGGYWTQANLARVKGRNTAGINKFKENDAWDHYCHQFKSPECISGTCADYAAGATIDIEEQESDQQAGRKVKLPMLVLYSASNLGSMHDVPTVWKQWSDGELKSVLLVNMFDAVRVPLTFLPRPNRTYGVPDDFGHFLPEECPEIIAKHVIEWINHTKV
jgi:hypothetical protein